MSNRQQKVDSFLNSLTGKELENYINQNGINNKSFINHLKKIKNTKPEDHQQKHFEIVGDKLNDIIQSYYKLGQANIIALILQCFYDEKYKIKDIQYYMKAIMDKDEN